MAQPDETPVECVSQAQLGSFLLVYEAWCHADVAKSEISWFQWLTNIVSSKKFLTGRNSHSKHTELMPGGRGHYFDKWEMYIVTLGQESMLSEQSCSTCQYFVNLKLLYPKIKIKSQQGIKDPDGH